MGHEQKVVIPTLGGDLARPFLAFSVGLGKIWTFETTTPANGTAGYAPGCLLVDNSISGATTLRVNNGSLTSSLFAAVQQP